MSIVSIYVAQSMHLESKGKEDDAVIFFSAADSSVAREA